MGTLRGSILTAARTVWAATALLLALAAILGVLIGAAGIAPPAPVLLAALLGGVVVAALGWRRRHVWLPALLLVALALGLWRYVATRPPGGPAGLSFYIGRDVTLVGTVAAEPEPLDRGQNVRMAVETLSVGSRARRVSGLVLVHLATLAPLSYGDRLSLEGTLAPPPDLPGGSPGSYRAYLAAQGIYTVLDYPRLRQLGTGAGNPLLALAIWLRQLLEGGIRRILPGPAGALLLGILLGTRTRALGALTTPFIATGMIHVVATDGVKVSLIVGTAHGVARRLLGVRWALVPALAVLLLYVLLTGATPAGLRSALMWMLALAALRFGRRSDAMTSLALAAAILTLLSPRILWDLGFQLSLAGTAAIIALAPDIERWLHRVASGIPAVLRVGLAVSLAAQLGTLPLLLSSFYLVSLVSPLANALLLPLLGPIFVLGVPAALAGALLPPLGNLLGLLVYPFLAAMIAVVQALARLPFAALLFAPLPTDTRALALVAGYYALLGLAAWGLHASNAALAPGAGPQRGVAHPTAARRHHPRMRPAWALGGAGVLLLATVAWQAPRPLYTLAVLPLGAGQGLLLTTPRGHAVLVDAGTAPSRLDAALGNRLPFWQARLDAVVLSDVDQAHTAGLRDLLAHYTVGRALDPGSVYPPADYALWRAALRDAGVPEAKLRTGARYRLDDGAYLDVLMPDGLDPYLPRTPAALRLVLGRLSVLLLNRSALDMDPVVLRADGVKRDTVLILPAGADDPRTYADVVRLLRPRLVVLPSSADARDDPGADEVARRAARAVGAGIWQGSGRTTLEITTDGVRYTTRVGS